MLGHFALVNILLKKVFELMEDNVVCPIALLESREKKTKVRMFGRNCVKWHQLENAFCRLKPKIKWK